MSKLYRKSINKNYNSETKMWREHHNKLQRLLHKQNKELYLIAKELGKFKHMIYCAIIDQLGNKWHELFFNKSNIL